MTRKFIRIAALFGAAAVILGAFGAHGLKPHFTPYQMEIFEKGVHYQFFHTLALFGIGLYAERTGANKWIQVAGWLMAAGIICFSGSLYLLASRDLIAFPLGWVGPVTPIGGLCFIAGWIAFYFSMHQPAP